MSAENKFLAFLIGSVMVVGIAGFVLGNFKSNGANNFAEKQLAENLLPKEGDEYVDTPLVPTLTPTPFLSPTPTLIPVGLPIRIEIPKMGVATNIVHVGITPENVMEVPTDASTIGWYTKGVKPGQFGGAILNGHYDTPTGRPAVFYNLELLGKGDEIIITTDQDERFVFRVNDLLSQPYKSFPKELVYGNAIGQELRLITCDGVWSSAERSYSKRLVIYASI